MQIVILAGGLGSRMAEETRHRPKPLVDVGGRPIIWHVMRGYAHFGFTNFLVVLGYRGEMLRQYLQQSPDTGDWDIECLDTDPDLSTGGRLRRVRTRLRGGTFGMAWADQLTDLDFRAMTAFHRSHGRLATVAAVHPPPRFGRLRLDGSRVVDFKEKRPSPGEWVSGGFFVLEPRALDYVRDDASHWDHEPMESLVADGQLMAFRHESFWQCMDTTADREHLEALCASSAPPWQRWA